MISLTTLRLLPVDGLRGCLMIVMALDHANALVAQGKLAPELWAGPFPNYQGESLTFLTRLVTHMAAPGFFLLMGAGMVLFALARQKHGWSRWRIVRHYLLRGCLLVVLQLTLENRVWGLGDSIGATYFGALYALGGVMIIGSFMLFLPMPVLMSISLALVIGTEVMLPRPAVGEYTPLLRLWLLPGYTPGVYVLYPLMPWLGVTGLGITFGRWLKRNPVQAYRGGMWLGIVAMVAFIIVRALNEFGNIRPQTGTDWIAFLNLVKYPPSLTFLLLMLGVDLVVLGVFGAMSFGTTHRSSPTHHILSGLAVYGRAPLFFYLIHLYLYAFIGSVISSQGMPIARMYPYWLMGLAILFPLCWVYGRFKRSRPPDSLWRLF